MSKDAKSLSAKIAQGEKTSPPQSEKEEKIIRKTRTRKGRERGIIKKLRTVFRERSTCHAE